MKCHYKSQCRFPVIPIPPQFFDYIVVGAGTSGCSVSRILLQKGYRVAILERGNRQPEPSTQIASNYTTSWLSNKNGITNLAEYNLDVKKRIDYVYGTAVGGSSNINFLVAVQPSDNYLQQLSNYVVFSESQLKSVSDSLRTLYKIDSTTIGSGPINISQIDSPIATEPFPFRTDLTTAISEAWSVPITDNYNNRVNECVDPYIQNFEKDNIRSSAKILIEGKNVFVNLEVTRLIRDGSVIRGVEWTNTLDGTHGQMFAKEVILTAGVLETAQIMIDSGIVSSAEFQNHYGSSLVAEISEELRQPWQRNGPIAFQSDIQMLSTPRALLTHCLLQNTQFNPNRVFSLLGWIHNSNVKSTITQSANGAIVIDSPLYSDSDKDVIYNMMTQMYNVIQRLRTNGIPVDIVYPNEILFADPDALYQAVKNNPSITYHMYATFPLGTALNSRFQYNGYTGLRIADLSVSPISPDGNTTYYALVLGTLCGLSI